MNVLVTGSNGFIGSRTCYELIRRGYDVVCIDNNSATVSPEYREGRRHAWKENVKFEREVDISDFQSLNRVFNDFKPDVVINLAAKAGVRDSVKNVMLYTNTNVQGVANLLHVMRKHEVKNLVQASTSSVYAGNITPFHEGQAIREVLSPYAASKYAAELLCQSWVNCEDLNCTVLRYFTVYGPYGRHDMLIDRVFKAALDQTKIQIFGEGDRSRSFTFVDDVATANAIAAHKTGTSELFGYNVINVGNEETETVSGITKRVAAITGQPVVCNHTFANVADMPHTCGEFTVMNKMLGFSTKFSIEEGLKKTFEGTVLSRKS